MGYLGRRIGKSQDTATDSNGSDGGGILDFLQMDIFKDKVTFIILLVVHRGRTYSNWWSN